MTFFRPTWVEIDLRAFRHNLKLIRQSLSPKTNILAVLKANAYGHGAIPLAKAAAQTGLARMGFGVSSVEEGLALREAGLKDPVLVLGSLFPFESFDAALRHHLTPTVASRGAALSLSRVARRLNKKAAFHLKVDTGMGRIGLRPQGVEGLMEFVKTRPELKLEGVYTHLAQVDSPEATRRQTLLFGKVVETVKSFFPRAQAHAANSGGVFFCKASHFDAVRPGLALYGVTPLPERGGQPPLRAVMSWKTRIVFLKTVPIGTAVSYGATWRASRRTRLATLPVGYADGYRRDLSNRGQVLVGGERCPVVGRVTMDQIIVDVTGVKGVDVGDEAVLLGRQGRRVVTAWHMADWCGTIPYEIFCGVSARVPRRFV